MNLKWQHFPESGIHHPHVDLYLSNYRLRRRETYAKHITLIHGTTLCWVELWSLKQSGDQKHLRLTNFGWPETAAHNLESCLCLAGMPKESSKILSIPKYFVKQFLFCAEEAEISISSSREKCNEAKNEVWWKVTMSRWFITLPNCLKLNAAMRTL